MGIFEFKSESLKMVAIGGSVEKAGVLTTLHLTAPLQT
jgi:hypothetical protein